MQRREFLGSVIGMLVATHVKFRAIPPPHFDPLSAPSDDERHHILMDAGDDFLAKMTGYYFTPDGTIKATPMRGFERTDGGISFFLHDWTATRRIVISKMGLILPDGRPLDAAGFHGGPQWLNSGDTLKGTHEINFFGGETR